MNKKIWIAVIALVAVVGILLGVYFATREDPVEGAKTVTVVVVHKDGTEKTFTCHTDATHLADVLLDEEIVEGSIGEFGLYFQTADGETADWSVDEGWWAIYDGDVQASVGASELVIEDGDVFRLVYTCGYAG